MKKSLASLACSVNVHVFPCMKDVHTIPNEMRWVGG